MFAKIEVNGERRHPLYQALIASQPEAVAPQGSEFLTRMTSKGRAPKHTGDILWNFEKFLIARDGTVIQRFSPDTTPEDPALVAAVKQALAG
ncbi:Glutathione peroxidase homolog BsaA [Serratia marcescens]|nr:Glutathione peroxidase homolog BsaA [Serratia marcescens]